MLRIYNHINISNCLETSNMSLKMLISSHLSVQKQHLIIHVLHITYSLKSKIIRLQYEARYD